MSGGPNSNSRWQVRDFQGLMAEFNTSNINPGLPGPTADEGGGSHARLAAARRTTVEPRSSWYLRFKRGADLVAGAILLVLLSPCIAIGALLVKLTSRGPAFYRQVRVGLDGREFTLYKLRTMRQDAEAETGPVWSTEFDARVTPLGRLLRCSHIDEFPQLWNVLNGEMSLVGPRPLPVDEVKQVLRNALDSVASLAAEPPAQVYFSRFTPDQRALSLFTTLDDPP